MAEYSGRRDRRVLLPFQKVESVVGPGSDPWTVPLYATNRSRSTLIDADRHAELHASGEDNTSRCSHTAKSRPWVVVVIAYRDETRASAFERYLNQDRVSRLHNGAFAQRQLRFKGGRRSPMCPEYGVTHLSGRTFSFLSPEQRRAVWNDAGRRRLTDTILTRSTSLRYTNALCSATSARP